MNKIEITKNDIPFYVLEHTLLINDTWILDNSFSSGHIEYHDTCDNFSQLPSDKFYFNRGVYFMRTSDEKHFMINIYGSALTDYFYMQKFNQISELASELRNNNHGIEYLHLLWKRTFSTAPLNSVRILECLICKYLGVVYEDTKLKLTYYSKVVDLDGLELLCYKEVNGIKLDRIYYEQLNETAFKHHYHLHIIGNIDDISKTLLRLTQTKNLKEISSILFRYKIPDLEVIS